MKDLLWQINIHARVKTNPYSLPYQKELVYKLGYESWLNEPYRINRITRKIAKELLTENIYSIRFYMLINVVESFHDESDIIFPRNENSDVEYRFRYFIKTQETTVITENKNTEEIPEFLELYESEPE